MSKYSKAKGRSSKQTYVMLRHDMMKSPAWLDLSTNARCIWTEIMLRYNGYNNGEIPLSCREAAERCNISPATAKRCFDELQDTGFIKVGSYGGFRNKHRYATRWIVTHLDNDLNGEKPTNEWCRWGEHQ